MAVNRSALAALACLWDPWNLWITNGVPCLVVTIGPCGAADQCQIRTVKLSREMVTCKWSTIRPGVLTMICGPFASATCGVCVRNTARLHASHMPVAHVLAVRVRACDVLTCCWSISTPPTITYVDGTHHMCQYMLLAVSRSLLHACYCYSEIIEDSDKTSPFQGGYQYR
jgi:hypothetical protein